MTTTKKASQDDSAKAIDAALIRELAALLDETQLSEIEVETAGLRLRVARQVVQHLAAPAALHHAAAAAAAEAAPAAGEDLANHPGVVASPMVGTAYMAPSPGAAPFVKVGDQVSEGQTLLIVEAMKTMNPIPAPRGGRVARILFSDAQPVEFGEPLVIIE
ncbi:MAG: acetyl-CoA carboxylase biotin carboxyl carrier protein [Alphaproteobacteria bacterium]|nr:acetyl-CoA carboxylase biotin carboxyl carrier protein [Alphaproteobacteria bacterium]